MRYSTILPSRSVTQVTVCFPSGIRTKTAYNMPIFLLPVATHSKAWTCSHSLSGITGLNLAGCVDFSLL